MRVQRKALIVASALTTASLIAASSARVAMAGDSGADRCPGQKLPLCREVETCSILYWCVTNYYYFPGGGEE